MNNLDKTEKFLNRRASFYNKVEKNDVSYMVFLEMTKKHVKENDNVLDFGCGTGLVCNEIANNCKNIYAFDFFRIIAIIY